MSAFDRILEVLKFIMEKFCAVLMIIMCLATFIQVINRFVFNGSFSWTDEIVIFSMVWVTFMGSAVAVTRNAHTRIDFFLTLLPKKASDMVLAFGDVVCAVFLLLLSYYTLPIARMNMNNLSTALQWPLAIVHSALIVCGLIMVLSFLITAVTRFKPEPGKEAANNG